MANYKVLATWDISIQNLYKDITLIQQGISCKLNISLRSISRVIVNYKVGNEYVTDLCTIDLDNNKVIVPFKKNVLEVGTHALELVCHMKNGDVLPTPNYSYTVTKSLTNDNDITEEDAYPVLIGMIQELTKNEAVIQANEEARANAEMYRELHEDERQNAEAERKANENTRISNENTRQSNESNRQQYETQRRAEEDERLTDEQVRVNAENIRIANENERLRKEIERQNAEELRQIAYNSSLYGRMDEAEDRLDEVNSQLAYMKNNQIYVDSFDGDDDSKIEQAFSQVERNNGGVIVFGYNKKYNIKTIKKIDLSENGYVEIIGNNSTIDFVSNTRYFENGIIEIGSITDKNIFVKIDNINVSATGVKANWGVASPNGGRGFFFLKAQTLDIRNCNFNDLFYSACIWSHHAKNVVIENCVGKNVGGRSFDNTEDARGDALYFGWMDDSDVNVKISNCSFYAHEVVENKTSESSSHSGRCGVVLGEFSTYENIKNFTIENCVFYNYQRTFHIENTLNTNLNVKNTTILESAIPLLVFDTVCLNNVYFENVDIKNTKIVSPYSGTEHDYINIGSVSNTDFNMVFKNCSFLKSNNSRINFGTKLLNKKSVIFNDCVFNFENLGEVQVRNNSYITFNKCVFNITSNLYYYNTSCVFNDCEIYNVGNNKAHVYFYSTYENKTPKFNGNTLYNTCLNLRGYSKDMIINNNIFSCDNNCVFESHLKSFIYAFNISDNIKEIKGNSFNNNSSYGIFLTDNQDKIEGTLITNNVFNNTKISIYNKGLIKIVDNVFNVTESFKSSAIIDNYNIKLYLTGNIFNGDNFSPTILTYPSNYILLKQNNYKCNLNTNLYETV